MRPHISIRLVTAAGIFLAASLAGAPPAAQVAAPTLVEDDLPEEEQPRQPASRRSPPQRAGEPVPEPVQTPVEPLPPPAPRSPVRAIGPAAPASRAPMVPGVSIGPEELQKLQRPIEPVKASWTQVLQWWGERRHALREHDLARAEAARRRILGAKRELAIETLPAFAAAEVREVEKALSARSPDDALQHAAFAVELAPDFPESHVALARARFAKAPTALWPVAATLWTALGAAAGEPHTRRALCGDAASALLAALLVAAAGSVGLLLLRRLRVFLHFFRHLPLLRSGTSAQAALVALVLLGAPLILGLGPFAVMFAATLAVWLHLTWSERAVATTALLVLVAAPYLAWGAARTASWTGTLAEQVHQIERTGAWEAAARLEAHAAAEGLPAPALLALGRLHKRRGDLEQAQRWYQSAIAADGRSAEAQVNLGNVLFLRGDLEGAKAAYLAAIDLGRDASTLAAAHYDLSKLYLRLAAVGQSTEARRKAQQQDAAYLARYGSDEDFGANRWLVDALVPEEQIAALARADPGPRSVGAAVQARFAGAIPREAWPALPLGLTAALWLLALGARRLGVPVACGKCGRPACRRCDGVAGALCGQCVNVFERQAVVDARDRLAKERQVRRYVRWREALVRALAVATGGAGHIMGGRPVRGFLLLAGLAFFWFAALFWRGVLPPPQPSAYLAVAKLVVAVPAGLLLYGLAVRDAFRLGRGG